MTEQQLSAFNVQMARHVIITVSIAQC